MPLKSQAQKRFMYAVASGSIKKPGLSKKEAKEFIGATKDVSSLPEKVKARKKALERLSK